MKQEVIEYLDSQKVGVIAIERLDGSLHGAAIHYAYSQNPFQFYFATERNSLKVDGLIVHGTSQATFVVGSDESAMKTIQLDGVVSLVTPEDHKNFEKVYFGKFGGEHKEDPEQLMFTF